MSHPPELELLQVVAAEHGCWGLNSGPLQEQHASFVAKPWLLLPFLYIFLETLYMTILYTHTHTHTHTYTLIFSLLKF